MIEGGCSGRTSDVMQKKHKKETLLRKNTLACVIEGGCSGRTSDVIPAIAAAATATRAGSAIILAWTECKHSFVYFPSFVYYESRAQFCLFRSKVMPAIAAAATATRGVHIDLGLGTGERSFFCSGKRSFFFLKHRFCF